MKRLAILAPAILLMALCAWSPLAKGETVSGFAKRIQAIQEEMDTVSRGTLFYYEILLYMPEFKDLESHAEGHLDECLEYLSETTHSLSQRRVAMLAMHRLPLQAWIHFANGVVDLHDRGKASAEDVMEVILPIHGFSAQSLDNFTNPGVRAILYRARKMPDLWPPDKKTISDILIGWVTFAKWLGPAELYK